MITVAVTGGIGSGKSTVSSALRERGAIVVDSDQLARQVLAPGTPGLAAIAERFGADMVDADGALDRRALAAVVFADPVARTALEQITHPRVRAGFAAAQQAAADGAIVVNDIPLLTTLAAAAGFHLVIGVRAAGEVRIERLIARGLTEADARARMAAQLSDQERAPLCDVVLSNDALRSALVAAVDSLWNDRLLPFERNTRLGRRVPRGGPQLMPPQEQWAVDARRLAARISAATGGARVDHIGSTAIPGMPAKDIIDLQLTVSELTAADLMAPALTAAGFPRPGEVAFDQDTPHPADDDPARWGKRFHANADPGRSVNLHLRVKDAPNWRWSLLFRDWLTAEPAVAQEYLAVKRSMADAHVVARDIGGYAEAKEPWIAAVYQRGLDWADRTGWTPDGG